MRPPAHTVSVLLRRSSAGRVLATRGHAREKAGVSAATGRCRRPQHSGLPLTVPRRPSPGKSGQPASSWKTLLFSAVTGRHAIPVAAAPRRRASPEASAPRRRAARRSCGSDPRAGPSSTANATGGTGPALPQARLSKPVGSFSPATESHAACAPDTGSVISLAWQETPQRQAHVAPAPPARPEPPEPASGWWPSSSAAPGAMGFARGPPASPRSRPTAVGSGQ